MQRVRRRALRWQRSQFALTATVMAWMILICVVSHPSQAQYNDAGVYAISSNSQVRAQHVAMGNSAQTSAAHAGDTSQGNLMLSQGMLEPGYDPWIGDQAPVYDLPPQQCTHCEDSWEWRVVPQGLIYRSYLAGSKEPRLSNIWFYEQEAGNLWDPTLGGRVSLLRYGTEGGPLPQGWELGVEGAAFVRLDLDEERDLIVADYRAGVPLTYANGGNEFKLAYYHLSAHIGDEYLIKNPGFNRINYSRDVIVFGYAFRPNDYWRFYVEGGYGVYVDGGADPWEFQGGIEYSSMLPTGLRGSPFVATNLQLHEEVDFGGRFTFQAGWQWRGDGPGHLFRLGVHYLNGMSPQYEFLGSNEEQIGAGVFYDF